MQEYPRYRLQGEHLQHQPGHQCEASYQAVYAATDKRIIIASGLVGYTYDSLNYRDIDNVSLHVGLFDRLFGTGDVIFTSEGGNRSFLDIEDFDEAYALIQQAVTDIQADIEYPNALRPQDNPGYNTRYTRDE